MMQVARLAPNLLAEAGDRVVDFLHGQLTEEGGARDRAGRSDLYYTVFLLEGLIALRADLPVEPVSRFLARFGDGKGLDFVHLACLARAAASLPDRPLDPDCRRGLARRLERFRSADGGYAQLPGADKGTVYAAFLALGAYQDLGLEHPQTGRLVDSVLSQGKADGGFANGADVPVGNTPATAAAATLLRTLERPVPETVSSWLLARCHESGGFLAMPEAPMPDLLSTATALHALAGLQVDVTPLKEPCLDFVDTLWTGSAFCGSWADDVTDCEYTYYGLLALGHLSVYP